VGIHRKATKRKIKFAKKLRRKQTRAERAFWEIAKSLREEEKIHFWRQTVLLGWIVDFWCPKLNLVVEIDGPTHEGREDYDANRARVMQEEIGATTIRFTNFDVINNPSIVKAQMAKTIRDQRRKNRDRNGRDAKGASA